MALHLRYGFYGRTEVVEGERESALGQDFGGAPADPLGGSGDEGNFHEVRKKWPCALVEFSLSKA